MRFIQKKQIKISSLSYTATPQKTSEHIQYIAVAVNIIQMEKMTEELNVYDGVGTLINTQFNTTLPRY